jgi:hypothetical protein
MQQLEVEREENRRQRQEHKEEIEWQRKESEEKMNKLLLDARDVNVRKV